MKKPFIWLLVAGFSLVGMKAGLAQAQLALGVKGGLNFAKLNASTDAAEQYNSKTGFHAGPFLLVKVSKIGIQPEIIFSQQGSKLEFNSSDYESNFSYVNIPLILKLYTVAGINLQAGPQFGFVTKAEQEYFDDIQQVRTKEDLKKELSGADVSIGLGIGWDLPFGLTIDARYNLGITKKDIPQLGTLPPSDEAKNQVIQVSLGYKIFKFGK